MYGGTKQEMQRLLQDAEKLSGVHYDLENLGDVYSAIHVIQEDLGLTGVAADEAATTFTGSMGAMKAAATNFLAELTTGGDLSKPLQTLVQSAMNFFNNNLVPMLGNLIKGLPAVINELLSGVIREINIVSKNADSIVSQGVELVSELVTGILSNLPYLAEAAINLITSFVDAIMSTDWASVAKNFIDEIKNNADIAAGEIFGSDTSLIESLMDWVLNAAPQMLDMGGEILVNLADGILSAIPTLLETGTQVLTTWWDKLAEAMPTMFEKGVEILTKLLDGIIDNLPAIIETVLKVITELVNNIGKNLPKILQAGIELLGKLAEGIIKAIPKLVAMLPQVFTAIINAFKNVNWLEIGTNIMEGIKNGIVNAVSGVISAVKDAAGQILDSAKSFLGIHSPSRVFRDEIGAMIPEGMAVGIKANTDSVNKAMDELSMQTISTGVGGLDLSYNYAPMSNDNNSESEGVGLLRELKEGILALQNMSIVMDTGATVGALAMPMNGALGRIQSREVRR